MSLRHSTSSERQASVPSWLGEYLGLEVPAEGEQVSIDGRRFLMRDGVLRDERSASERQEQTSEAFGFKWQKRDTFESEASLERMREWLIERYGDVAQAEWWSDYGDAPVLLDAG